MNYLTEILEFNNWLDENPSPPSVIVLWYALMNICNRLKWKKSFTAPIKTLELKTGLKKDAIYRARNNLKQHGLIDFAEQGGRKCAVYTIIPFSEQTGESCVVLNDANRDTSRNTGATQTATQTVRTPQPFYKQNKTKYKSKNINRMGFMNFENPEPQDYADIEQKLIDMMLE